MQRMDKKKADHLRHGYSPGNLNASNMGVFMITPSIFCTAVLLLFLGGFIQVLAQDAKPATSSDGDHSNAALTTIAFPTVGDQQTSAPTATTGKTRATQPTIPLSAKQKLAYGARRAFLDPLAYLSPAVDAYFVERSEVKAPGKTAEDKFADGLSRYARSFATGSTAALLGSGVYPALFKQDPRYHPSGKHGFMPRALYAASRTLLTQGDNGTTQINYSSLAGNLTSAGLANFYERDVVRARDAHGRPLSFRRRVGVGPTFESFGISTALNAAANIAFREFDVVGKLRKIFRKP